MKGDAGLRVALAGFATVLQRRRCVASL